MTCSTLVPVCFFPQISESLSDIDSDDVDQYIASENEVGMYFIIFQVMRTVAQVVYIIYFTRAVDTNDLVSTHTVKVCTK